MENKNINKDIINCMKSDFETGFKMLFLEYYKPMIRVAGRMIDSHFAEDIVQDILLNIWRKQIQFESELSLKSYIYSAVHNGCVSMIRKNKSKDKYLTNVKDFYEAIIDEDLYQLLMNAVNELPENYRQVIELYLSGNSVKEIASKMGTTEDSVKSYKKRAKIILSRKKGGFIIL